MIDFLTRLRDVINGLRPTPFKMVSTIGLTYLTFLWAMLASLVPRELTQHPVVSEIILGSLLAFLAAAWGINYKQFGKERDTDYGALDRQAVIERAKAAPASSVTVESAGTVKAEGDVTVQATPVDAGGTTR